MTSPDDFIMDELVDARGAPVMPLDEVWKLLAPLGGRTGERSIDRTEKMLAKESEATLLQFAQGLANAWLSVRLPESAFSGFEGTRLQEACVWRGAVLAGGPKRVELVNADEHSWRQSWVGNAVGSVMLLPGFALQRKRGMLRKDHYLWVAAQHDFPGAFMPEGTVAMPPPGPPVPRSRN